MKFALLIAAVSAITIVKESPSSSDDPEHTYSQHVNNAHKLVTDASAAHQERFDKTLEQQEKADEWRKGYDGPYNPHP